MTTYPPYPAGLDPDHWRTVVLVVMDAVALLDAWELNWLKLYGIAAVQRKVPRVDVMQDGGSEGEGK